MTTEGQGSAEDAAVSFTVRAVPLDELAHAEDRVTRAEKKVQKQREHLANAEEALAAAVAARDALAGGSN